MDYYDRQQIAEEARVRARAMHTELKSQRERDAFFATPLGMVVKGVLLLFFAFIAFCVWASNKSNPEKSANQSPTGLAEVSTSNAPGSGQVAREDINIQDRAQDVESTAIAAAATDAQLESVASAVPSQKRNEIKHVTWLKRPTDREVDESYPKRALKKERSGRVVLGCIVGQDGTLECVVNEEEPVNWGFGEAALSLARSFKIAAETTENEPTAGGYLQIPISFRAQ